MKKALSKPPIYLDDAEGIHVVLEDVKTEGGLDDALVSSIEGWLKDLKGVDAYKSEPFDPLDLAIVVDVSKRHLDGKGARDVDNIPKKLLDLLKMDEAKPSKPYLFRDDKQVARLLVWKRLKRDYRKRDFLDYETHALHLSFRKHDCKKHSQMILVQQECGDF